MGSIGPKPPDSSSIHSGPLAVPQDPSSGSPETSTTDAHGYSVNAQKIEQVVTSPLSQVSTLALASRIIAAIEAKREVKVVEFRDNNKEEQLATTIQQDKGNLTWVERLDRLFQKLNSNQNACLFIQTEQEKYEAIVSEQTLEKNPQLNQQLQKSGVTVTTLPHEDFQALCSGLQQIVQTLKRHERTEGGEPGQEEEKTAQQPSARPRSYSNRTPGTAGLKTQEPDKRKPHVQPGALHRELLQQLIHILEKNRKAEESSLKKKDEEADENRQEIRKQEQQQEERKFSVICDEIKKQTTQ